MTISLLLLLLLVQLLLLLFKLQAYNHSFGSFVSVCLVYFMLMYAFYTYACMHNQFIAVFVVLSCLWVWIYGGLHLHVLTILTTQSVSLCAWALEHPFFYGSNEREKKNTHKRMKKKKNQLTIIHDTHTHTQKNPTRPVVNLITIH